MFLYLIGVMKYLAKSTEVWRAGRIHFRVSVLSTAFGSVTCATAIWLYILQPKIAIDLKLYSSVSLNVMCTVVDCNNHCQITVAHVTQPMTVNWL